MGTLSYLKDSGNLFPNATLTETTENSSFPVENMNALPISKPYKTADAALTGQKIIIDFGSAQTMDIFALVNHNLQSGATITVKGGNSSDPGSVITTITWREGLAWDILGSSVSHRYWSLTLDDAGNPDNHLRVGYFIMGLKTDLVVNQFHEWSKERVKRVRQVENELGAPMVGAKIYEGTRITMSFLGLTDSERDTIDTFLDSLDIKIDPILLVPEATEADAFFSRLEAEYTIEQSEGVAHIRGVPFITDSLGTVITA